MWSLASPSRVLPCKFLPSPLYAVLCFAVLSAVVCSAGRWQRDSGPPSSCPPPPRAASARPSRPCTNVPFVMQMEAAFFSCTDTKFAVSTSQLLVRFQACSGSFFAAITVELFRALFRWSTNCTSLFLAGWWCVGGGVDWVSMHALWLQQLLWWREQATILRMFKQFPFISALSQTSVQLGLPKNLVFPGFAGRYDHYRPRSECMLFFNNLRIWSHICVHGKW